MLAVPEAAAGQQDWQVRVEMGVAVAHVRSEEHHRAVEEPAVPFVHVGKPLEESSERPQACLVDPPQFGQLLRLVAMVREGMRAVAHAGELRCDLERVEIERDETGAVGLDRKPRHRIHQLHPLDHLGPVGDVLRQRFAHRRLGSGLPGLGMVKPLLQFPHAREILVESLPVCGRQRLRERPGLVEYEVENARAAFDLGQPSGRLLGRVGQEEPAVDLRGLLLRRDEDAVSRHGEESVVPLTDGQHQRLKPCRIAELLGGELIDRDRVAEGHAPRVAGPRQKHLLTAVAARHVWMRHAAQDREIVPHTAERLEIRAQRIVAAWVFGEKVFRDDASVDHHADHPPRRCACIVTGSDRLRRHTAAQMRAQRLEPRQGDGRAHTAEHRPPGDHGDRVRCRALSQSHHYRWPPT